MLNQNFWRNKNVFITGHTGFKGAWLSYILCELGAKVTGYSFDPETSPNLYSLLELTNRITNDIRGDINDCASLASSMIETKPDIVFHLAAQSLVRESYVDPLKTYQTNVMGTLNVLEAIRNCQTVKSSIIVTTDKCYENPETSRPFKESDPLGGYDPYSSSKACAEILTSSYRRSFLDENTQRVFTVRAGNVIGGGDWNKDRIITDLFQSISQGKLMSLRNPQAIRPWQHVLEPLEAYLMIAEAGFVKKLNSDSFNIGPQRESVKTVEWIVEQFGKSWGLPSKVETSKGNHPHEALNLTLDNSKVQHMLDWKPRFTLEEAVRMTSDWYKVYLEYPEKVISFTRSQILKILVSQGPS
jgi:CDP-glucose 4,6-dehydratase